MKLIQTIKGRINRLFSKKLNPYEAAKRVLHNLESAYLEEQKIFDLIPTNLDDPIPECVDEYTDIMDEIWPLFTADGRTYEDSYINTNKRIAKDGYRNAYKRIKELKDSTTCKVCGSITKNAVYCSNYCSEEDLPNILEDDEEWEEEINEYKKKKGEKC